MAVFGTLGGIGLGMFLGWGLMRALVAQEGFGAFAAPINSLAVVLGARRRSPASWPRGDRPAGPASSTSCRPSRPTDAIRPMTDRSETVSDSSHGESARTVAAPGRLFRAAAHVAIGLPVADHHVHRDRRA